MIELVAFDVNGETHVGIRQGPLLVLIPISMADQVQKFLAQLIREARTDTPVVIEL